MSAPLEKKPEKYTYQDYLSWPDEQRWELIERSVNKIMSRVASKNTAPEIKLREALEAKNLEFNTNPANILGKPDIVFPSKRVVIFIDGDFWHGGQWVKRQLSSLEEQFQHTETQNYWLHKIRRNMERDSIITSKLTAEGWTVIRLWESDIYKNLERCVAMVFDAIDNSGKVLYSEVSQKSCAEFFAGIGLMRIGLEKQGWQIAFANDIDPQKQEIYQSHFRDESEHLVLGDIHKLKTDDIPSVTLATASFPCNDLSLAGARNGLSGKHSSAFWGFINIIREMAIRKPPVILLENVTGFLTSHGGDDFKEALLALNSLGYSTDAFIIDAARFVPQSRQRLFVVGILDQLSSIWEVKEQLQFYESDVRPKALAEFILKHSEIRWNIRDLPNLPSLKSTLKDIIEDLPETSNFWWSRERAEYLLNQMSPKHREIAEKMISGNDYSYGTVFRRVRNDKSMGELRTDGLAGCLRTPRGGSGRQILFKAGKGRYFARLLTPRECARLMGVDDYTITVSLNQALFGFGDAVCVPVIEWIAKYYLNPVVTELIHQHPMRVCK
jgi:DNA (cytosine-5)-methyltransferase 1